MKNIIDKLQDGGVGITLIVLIALISIVALFVKELILKSDREKNIKLISSIAWFALAWGFFGRTIGLIKAFDTIQIAGKLTPEMVSGGLKMALVGPIFAIFVFAIARIEIIILILLPKKEKTVLDS
ncbi:MAG: MotA/TolQ/ExbB proton channel family protein [Bacteroidales bacterium]|nr:MotA/TolQ/ExbB proton channel family protein [Bacteroidales bacterium]